MLSLFEAFFPGLRPPSGCPFARFYSKPADQAPMPPRPRVQRLRPPGPWGWPVLGSYLSFVRNPVRFLQSMVRQYGDVAYFRLGRQGIYHINDPVYAHNILVRDHASFERSGLVMKLKHVLGDGLVATDGELHRSTRRKILPGFSSSATVEQGRTLTGVVRQAVSDWRNGDIIDVTREMNRVALCNISAILFGADFVTRTPGLHEAIREAAHYFSPGRMAFSMLWGRFNPSPAARRFRRAKAFLEKTVDGMMVDAAEGRMSASPLLSLLLANFGSEDRGASARAVRDQVMTILLTGHDTVASSLNWLFYLLAQHPDAERRCHEEIDRVFGGDVPTVEKLEELVYTDKVIREVLRLYPAAWGFKRRALKDVRVGPYSIPAGSVIGFSPYVTHRDPRFFPDPDAFNPLRWSDTGASKRLAQSYFPFSAGPYSCIGAGLAIVEMKTVLAIVGQRWRLRLEPGQNPGLLPLVTLAPRRSIRMRLERRAVQASSTSKRYPTPFSDSIQNP